MGDLMRSLPLAFVFASFSAAAFAAEAPNVVGAWIPVEHSSVRIGPREGLPTYSTASSTHDLHFAWKLVITAQDGPAFAGYNTGPSGKPKDLVGVFRTDGVRFVMSTEGGAATGEVMGNKLEFCFTDAIPVYVAAGCTIYQRQ
jgi:hypothetical protein